MTERATDEKLAECPFCGGSAIMHVEQTGRPIYYVRCDGTKPDHCNAIMPPRIDEATNRDAAIAAWNRRAPLAEIERLREALTKAAEQFEFYACEHREKMRGAEFNGLQTAASMSLGKALTNEEFAAMCRAALPEPKP